MGSLGRSNRESFLEEVTSAWYLGKGHWVWDWGRGKTVNGEISNSDWQSMAGRRALTQSGLWTMEAVGSGREPWAVVPWSAEILSLHWLGLCTHLVWRRSLGSCFRLQT